MRAWRARGGTYRRGRVWVADITQLNMVSQPGKVLGPTRWVIGFVMQHEVLIPSWLVMKVLTCIGVYV